MVHLLVQMVVQETEGNGAKMRMWRCGAHPEPLEYAGVCLLFLLLLFLMKCVI